MSWSTINRVVTDGVAIVTFDRPTRMNGITHAMTRELYEALLGIVDDDSVAVVILTGAGRAFCAGADLAHFSRGEPDEPRFAHAFDVPVLLHEMPQVTIAAINGGCAGAGLGYACACDLRYAARSARLNTAFLDVAVAGDMGLPWTLPRLVGSARARELSLFPRKLTADEAAAYGMVNGVFDDDALHPEVRALAGRLAASAPLARRALKEHYVAAERMGFADFISLEAGRHRQITPTEDCREAFAAFLEKRPARFVGR